MTVATRFSMPLLVHSPRNGQLWFVLKSGTSTSVNRHPAGISLFSSADSRAAMAKMYPLAKTGLPNDLAAIATLGSEDGLAAGM